MSSTRAELVNRLHSIQQRVAHQRQFDACVVEIETLFDSLEKQASELAKLAFCPDVALMSHDGIKVPALEQTLVDASNVFRSMFADHTSEHHNGVVNTDASAAALRFVVERLHSSLNTFKETDPATLLEVCELAERWNLPDVLDEAARNIRSSLDASTACKTLESAERHMQVEGGNSSTWKNIIQSAASLLATSMPSAAEVPEFKTLSVQAIVHVMLHVKSSHVELPSIDANMLSDVDAPFGEPVSWLPGAQSTRFRLFTSVKDDGGVNLHVDRDSDMEFSILLESGTLKAVHPSGNPTLTRTLRNKMFGKTVLRQSGVGGVLTAENKATYTLDGAFRLEGNVVLAKEQRQSEVFNLWLIASGRAEAPLSPLVQLQCLRTCACDFDFDAAESTELTEKLTARGLSADGSVQALRTRLRDAMFAELQMDPAMREASNALARLSALHFPAAASDGSLVELDASSMSQVLAHEDLNAKSESAVLEHVLSWASYAGRSDEMIDKVMPLVRMPLVSMITPPAALRDLKARSSVVTELVTEAVKQQVSPSASVNPSKKHALLPSMPEDTEQPRHKRRKLCLSDKIPTVDAAEAVVSLAF